MMEEDEEGNESDYDEQSDDEDEQIQEIDIIKRQRVESDDEYGDEEDLAMAPLDDSVSSENEVVEKKSKKDKKSKSKKNKKKKDKGESEEE